MKNSYILNGRNLLPKNVLALMVAITLFVGLVPLLPGGVDQVYGADDLMADYESTVLVVTGKEVTQEKAYTMNELKALEELTLLFSAINTNPTSSIYAGKGITLEKLLAESGVDLGKLATVAVEVIASDGYAVKFDPDHTGDSATRGKPLKTPALSVERFYFPNIALLEVAKDDEGVYSFENAEAAKAGGLAVKAMLAWERGGERGQPDVLPTKTQDLSGDEKPLLLMLGQQHVGEQNNPHFNKTVNQLVAGDAIEEKVISILAAEKSRAEVLLMGKAAREYTYTTSVGEKTDAVKGVPLAMLIEGVDPEARIDFTSADGYKVAASGKTVAELMAANYILAYEKGDSFESLTDILETAKGDSSIKGYFTLYGDGDRPAKFIDSIELAKAEEEEAEGAVEFSDIKGHWAKTEIEFLANAGIIKGKGEGRFDPQGKVSRAEFLTMLANSDPAIDVAGTKDQDFDDVIKSAWYADYVNWGASEGIVSGLGDNKFGPDKNITREQMAVMTENFVKARGLNLSLVKDEFAFTDKASISSWASEAVTKVQRYGVISGHPDGSFAPKDTASRAQAAVIIKGYLDAAGNNGR